VAISQHFQFALAPRTTAEQDQHDCSVAAQWLEAALAWLGAGAKTAVGYGRFCRNDAAEKKAVSENIRRKAEAELSARLAKLSPLAGELELACQTGHWEVRKEMFAEAGLIEGWLAKLEATPDADAIRRLGGLVNHHFHGLLTNPEKSEGKKNKPVFKERQRQFARRLNELLTKIS
jgi:CRISPR-associated protein Cmr6